MAMGLVPSILSAPHNGATSFVELVMAQPIRSLSSAFKRIVARDAEMIGVAHAHPA